MSVKRRSRSDALTVLIVDDDVDARRIYGEYLRVKGMTAFSSTDGRSGIEKANDLKPDVIVLDLAMPRVDGWTVLKHLRESSWTSPIPIIVVTANHAVRDEAFQAGCDAYLLKPCPPETLWLQVRALLRMRPDVVAGSSFDTRLEKFHFSFEDSLALKQSFRLVHHTSLDHVFHQPQQFDIAPRI